MATSERHVQRTVNDGLDLIVDGSLTFSVRPSSLSTSPISPNWPSCTAYEGCRSFGTTVHTPTSCLLVHGISFVIVALKQVPDASAEMIHVGPPGETRDQDR